MTTEVRLTIELQRPKVGLGRFRCAVVVCRAVMVNAERIGVLMAGDDEILVCAACAATLVEKVGPRDRPADTLLLDEEGRARQQRIYVALHRRIGSRWGGFKLIECDDGAVRVNAATGDLSQPIEAHLVEVGIEVTRRNSLLLEVRSETGLEAHARTAKLVAMSRGADAVI
jgi:hypothetical protein